MISHRFTIDDQYDLLEVVRFGLYLRLWRYLRREAYPQMGYGLATGCIAGLETVLDVKIGGQPIGGIVWRLYRRGKLLERGRTDEHGRSRVNSLVLEVAGPHRFEINEDRWLLDWAWGRFLTNPLELRQYTKFCQEASPRPDADSL